MKISKLAIVCFILTAMLVIGGCGSSGETPEQAVTNALNAVKNLDKETAQKYFAYEDLMSNSENELLEDQEILKLFVKNFNFKVLSSSIEGDTATVKTEITNMDMKQILGEYMKQAMGLAFGNAFSGDPLSDEEMDKQAEQILMDLLKKEDNKLVTSTVDIKLTKTETSWKLDMDDAAQDAITGGLKSAAESMNSGDEDSPKGKLREIDSYITTDIWSKGFCDIAWYIVQGTGNTGDSLDIDFTLQQLADAMAKKQEYDIYINSLDTETYGKVKQIWSKLSPEIDKLYTQIQEKKPIANDSNYEFDTGLFTQYHDAFSDEIDNLAE